MQDRRQSPRVTAWSPLTLKGPEGSIPATLKNLSLAGVSCISSQPFPEMTRLQLALVLSFGSAPDSRRESLTMDGVVVRCEPVRGPALRRDFEVAIFFQELTDAARRTLVEFLATRREPSPTA